MTGLRVETGAVLAIDGGSAVRAPEREWPGWPVPGPAAESHLAEVLHGGRWAITSPRRGDLFERRFARMFARYVGTRHCVPTDHGSSALVIALESLGLAYGDPVLVPALTWTACATAVLRAGLLPVLADVDPETGCLDVSALRADDDVRAVVAVHWACGMADIPAIEEFASVRGIQVVEDAAQAHGARWLGRPAGSLGRLGCFSMQHSKVLTCGEGGAVVTDDDALLTRLEELRADSRSWRDDARPGELDLRESATVLGANFCLSEFGAALLCAQLPQLDAQNAVRERNYERLRELLVDVPGVRLLTRRPEQDRVSLYEVPVVFDPLPPHRDNSWVAAALTAEVGMRAYPPRAPLQRSPLLRPWTKPALAPLSERFVARHRGRVFPGADRLARHAVLLHHSAFLGPESDMLDLARGIAKVAGHLRKVGRT
ncbi:3-amino-5-hydroxybenzoate synthase [Plantactinospora mayteni]|uniref:3-amino-5-hydroxybenzoate synthase n=1 Tax=Plantactinospora mayteni TaxID=566021 RepID=A0ABQ4EFR8_9ACTN|nr:DegT/DnrJ/EryC1/StrS family aminotransferase [Plantactinospora mayteni]GIG93562.1 3-amino-5-hydroxybenzoate synthase [Plantactinospora mayteni]